ncbi:tyrosine-protein phosphatase non-receptor type 1 [Erpetoichthys calabaricus]|uniref:Tyrosine-protein phosphatase non-receptor type n=1 Tax=Erpetoichthys calabaricus TaxID=27687 RepID=A0A8C4XA99_ERPCA|nr:tyrosine-protein phosphatase non-receptor type 1 [Erpetoichthys calabaricus]
MATEMEAEFLEIDESGNWNSVYQAIRQQSVDMPCKYAKLQENKNRNRYRDVSPFDHSRIRLQLGDNDYINASLISMEEAQRNYILTQGPLPNTCGHFWEMVWEQRTHGVVMLNRVIEKGSMKCAQYWPQEIEKEMVFEDVNLQLTFISEDVKSYYTVRHLELKNLTTQESRVILHFHYTTWPDFGVPESPASFLNFLFKVRESGCLNSDQGPVVVHCSAGIGRSGTFCLADTCLLLMSLRKDPSSVRIRDVLLEMRKYRMGLIQTADQLRFSYLAVIEGAKCILGDSSVQQSWKELSNEEDTPPEFTPPPPLPPPRPPKRPGVDAPNGRTCDPTVFFPPSPIVAKSLQTEATDIIMEQKIPAINVYSENPELRRRAEKDPVIPSEIVDGQKILSENRSKEEAEDGNSVAASKRLLANVCLYTALALGAYVCYRAFFH